MDEIMAVYLRHKVVVDAFVTRGDVIGIGPFWDGGNMANFRTKAAADAFVAKDPFILGGLVASYTVRPWLVEMLEQPEVGSPPRVARVLQLE